MDWIASTQLLKELGSKEDLSEAQSIEVDSLLILMTKVNQTLTKGEPWQIGESLLKPGLPDEKEKKILKKISRSLDDLRKGFDNQNAAVGAYSSFNRIIDKIVSMQYQFRKLQLSQKAIDFKNKLISLLLFLFS
jgi:hypothetical protein